ncbi:MAG: DUF1761 domain-containing protein [Dehalococcoidia bacterium]
MNLESIEPNYLIALIGGVAYFAVGWAWYSPMLFTDRWLAAQGKTREGTATAPEVVPLALNLVASIVVAMVVAAIYEWGGGDGVVDGIVASLIVSVGVVAMEAFKGIAYYAQTWMLYAINVAYAIVGIGVAGAIYGAFA